MFMTMDNKTRRSCAFVALETYLEAKDEEPEENKVDQITDLITDLLHLAVHEHAADPEAMVHNALNHYNEEEA